MIADQPGSQPLIVPGQSASFMVIVLGDSLTYQWQKDGIDITGAIFANYTILSVTERSEGMYRCIVSNDAGTVTSDTAQLTVCKFA